MALVLDASIAAAWYFPDEDSALATRVARGLATAPAVVPALFWFEIRNTAVVGERRGWTTAEDTARFLGRLDALPLEVDAEPVGPDLLTLARDHRLTAYDAAYLELARRRGVPLATLDDRLAAAATAAGVPLAG